MFLFSGHSNAASINAQVGKDFTELTAGIGSKGAGLGINGNWTRSDHDGQVTSLGATFGLPLGPLALILVAKLIIYHHRIIITVLPLLRVLALIGKLCHRWRYMGKFMARRVI